MTNPLVLIVGAGPTGLALANELALQQIPFRIVDQEIAPATLSKAIAVQARTLELLERFPSVAERLVNAGIKLTHGKIRSATSLLAHLDLTQIPSSYPFVLSIPQDVTENILRDHLKQQGYTVEFGVKLISFAEHPNGVSVSLQMADQTMESIAVPWVVACDGAHSSLRQQLNLPFSGSTFTDQRFMLADVYLNKALDPHELRVFLAHGNIFAIFPLPDKHFRLIVEMPADDVQGELGIQQVQKLMNSMVDKNLTIEKVFWFSEFRINQRKINNYRVGNIFFAGDAAHIHSPVGGQGMNTGIQDAINLGWKLAEVIKGLAQPALLETYHAEREAVGAQLLRATDVASRAMFVRSPLLQKIRNFCLKSLLSFSAVRKKVLLNISELAIHYRQSPLSQQHFLREEGIFAGDRWPDDILPSLDATRWHLLLVDVDIEQIELLQQNLAAFKNIVWWVISKKNFAAQPKINVIMDTEEKWIKQLAHQHPAAYLIRPDRYVAYRAQPIVIELLLDYLNAWLMVLV